MAVLADVCGPNPHPPPNMKVLDGEKGGLGPCSGVVASVGLGAAALDL